MHRAKSWRHLRSRWAFRRVGISPTASSRLRATSATTWHSACSRPVRRNANPRYNGSINGIVFLARWQANRHSQRGGHIPHLGPRDVDCSSLEGLPTALTTSFASGRREGDVCQRELKMQPQESGMWRRANLVPDPETSRIVEMVPCRPMENNWRPVCWERPISHLDVATGEEALRDRCERQARSFRLASSADGQRWQPACNGRMIALWDAKNLRATGGVNQPREPVYSAVFLPMERLWQRQSWGQLGPPLERRRPDERMTLGEWLGRWPRGSGAGLCPDQKDHCGFSWTTEKSSFATPRRVSGRITVRPPGRGFGAQWPSVSDGKLWRQAATTPRFACGTSDSGAVRTLQGHGNSVLTGRVLAGWQTLASGGRRSAVSHYGTSQPARKCPKHQHPRYCSVDWRFLLMCLLRIQPQAMRRSDCGIRQTQAPGLPF